MSLQKQPITLAQRLGKEPCFLVRQFGARPWVVSQFWVKLVSGKDACDFIRSSGRSHNQKTERVVSLDYLCATREDANALRDELKAVSPEQEYKSLS